MTKLANQSRNKKDGRLFTPSSFQSIWKKLILFPLIWRLLQQGVGIITEKHFASVRVLSNTGHGHFVFILTLIGQ